MSVLDVEFLFDPPVAGDAVYRPGDIAPMAVTIVNSGDAADRLVRVTSPIAEAGVVVVDGGLVIPGDRTLTAGQVGPVSAIEVPYEDDAGLIALIGLREPIRSGVSYPVVFGFERAGDVAFDVPVDTPDYPPPRAGDPAGG
jgi:copper(I)-binding protein